MLKSREAAAAAGASQKEDEEKALTVAERAERQAQAKRRKLKNILRAAAWTAAEAGMEHFEGSPIHHQDFKVDLGVEGEFGRAVDEDEEGGDADKSVVFVPTYGKLTMYLPPLQDGDDSTGQNQTAPVPFDDKKKRSKWCKAKCSAGPTAAAAEDGEQEHVKLWFRLPAIEAYHYLSQKQSQLAAERRAARLTTKCRRHCGSHGSCAPRQDGMDPREFESDNCCRPGPHRPLRLDDADQHITDNCCRPKNKKPPIRCLCCKQEHQKQLDFEMFEDKPPMQIGWVTMPLSLRASPKVYLMLPAMVEHAQVIKALRRAHDLMPEHEDTPETPLYDGQPEPADDVSLPQRRSLSEEVTDGLHRVGDFITNAFGSGRMSEQDGTEPEESASNAARPANADDVTNTNTTAHERAIEQMREEEARFTEQAEDEEQASAAMNKAADEFVETMRGGVFVIKQDTGLLGSSSPRTLKIVGGTGQAEDGPLCLVWDGKNGARKFLISALEEVLTEKREGASDVAAVCTNVFALRFSSAALEDEAHHLHHEGSFGSDSVTNLDAPHEPQRSASTKAVETNRLLELECKDVAECATLVRGFTCLHLRDAYKRAAKDAEYHDELHKSFSIDNSLGTPV